MADFAPLPTLLEAEEPPPLLPAVSAAEIGAARLYVEASRAASTRRAYDGDWRRFSQWCRPRAAEALPAAPPLVAVYLSVLAATGKTPPTIGRALAAIAHAHKRAGHAAPRALSRRMSGRRAINCSIGARSEIASALSKTPWKSPLWPAGIVQMAGTICSFSFICSRQP